MNCSRANKNAYMKTRFLWPILTLFCAVLIGAASMIAQTPAKLKIWAAVTSVPGPLVTAGQVERLQIHFAMVNDGNKPIDPKVSSWRLNINGKDHPDSEFMFANGPRDDRWKSLPVGDCLQFSYVVA